MRRLGRATALGVAARRRKAGNLPLLRTLQDLGVATNLELCLDAGDYASYTGSGQSWLDTSGNGYDFFRGADVNASTDDPTWAGTAGALTKNEYWSFDGGDFFTYDTTNETWMENLHKDNAVGTLAGWVYYVSNASNQHIAATSGAAGSTIGMQFRIQSNSALSFIVADSGIVFQTAQSNATLTNGAWNFFALSIDESVGAGGALFQTNGTQNTQTSTYTSPSASAATYAMHLCVLGDGSNFKFASGSRMAQFMGWSRALTAAELSDIYTKTRTRFGV